MAVTRSINRSMMQSNTGNSLSFNNVYFATAGLTSPYNVQYTSVNETNSKLKTRCKQAEAVIGYPFAYISYWDDTSTSGAAYGAAPYKMSDFYDLTLDTIYSYFYHVPASGQLSIGNSTDNLLP